MDKPTLLVALALILALVSELHEHGESLIGWAVVFVCVALLWGKVP